jgi:hypothetical protein
MYKGQWLRDSRQGFGV